jgi:iron complex outermembrane receptor protein
VPLRGFCIITIALLLNLAAKAQIQHTVVLLDNEDRNPIQGALLLFSSDAGKCQAISDSLGHTIFGPVTLPGIFEIRHPNFREVGRWELLPDTLLLRSFTRVIPAAKILADQTLLDAQINSSGTQGLLPEQMKGNSRLSMVPLMGFVPGVRMDERGYGGSRRLSIRGGFSRSPFGVRGIPLYIDGIPFTGPEGSTNIEFMDADLTHELSIFKGPAPAAYGSTANGAISLQTERAEAGTWSARAGIALASFSTFRSSFGVRAAYSRHEITFDHIFQQSDGYRDQEFNRKQQWQLKIIQRTGNKSRLLFQVHSWFGSWGLPGSLNALEAERNPAQARPFSLEQNAGLRKYSGLGALSYERKGRRTFLSALVFLSSNSKKNPYGTSPFYSGLKLEKSRGIGARIYARTKLGRRTNALEWGAETQEEAGYFHEFENIGGQAGAQKYRNNSRFHRSFAFSGVTLRFGSFRINPSLVCDFAGMSNRGFTEVLKRDLGANNKADARWLPSLSLFYNGNVTGFSEWSISWKRGLGRPGIFEIVDVENGIINTDLHPEQGDLLELSWKLDVPNRISAMATTYGFIRKENILPAIDVLERVSYVNGGDARFFGIEFSGSAEVWRGRWIKQMLLMAQGAVQRYYDSGNAYKDYVPGVPLHTAGVQTLLKFNRGFALDIQHRWSDQLPLNDSNTDWLPAWHTLEARISYRRNTGWGNVEIYAGSQNLTGNSYTGFAQINAPAERYYNPVPERNYYAGMLIRPSGKIRGVQ